MLGQTSAKGECADVYAHAPSAYGRAQEYAACNSDYLRAHYIHPRVTAIRVNQAEHKVYVRLEADASSLFLALLRGILVRGEAEARIGNR
jgi:hypothetical protein